MEFKTIAHKLVARICSYCRENNLPSPGQVRTTKLVYLVECYYYSWEQKPLTALDWIFWHYGPWSPALDKVLKRDFGVPPEQESETDKFIPVHWAMPEFDKPKLKFGDVTAEGVVLTVLGRFAALPYNELLNYVYFETAPMKTAVRGKSLDFSNIHRPQRFVDPVSLLPSKVFHELRAEFEKLEFPTVAEGREGADDVQLWELLEAMDDEGSFVLPEGEVVIDDEVRSELRADSKG